MSEELDGAAGPDLLERLIAGGAHALNRALGSLPHERSLTVGAALGRAWYRLDTRRMRDARINLRIAFPEWSEPRRERVLRASMENLGRSLAEFSQFGRRPEQELVRLVRVEGQDHIEAALERAKPGGLAVLTAHLDNWEFLGFAMAGLGYPLSIVHRERDNPLLDRVVMGQRDAGRAEMLPRGNAARAGLRALRDGRALAMPYDQNCARNEAVFAPFFGHLAACRAGPAKIVMKTGVPMVPVFMHREPDGLRHVCRVHPYFELESDPDDPAGALARNIRHMVGIVEREIRRTPEQWLWVHRRFRTQPEGEPKPYG